MQCSNAALRQIDNKLLMNLTKETQKKKKRTLPLLDSLRGSFPQSADLRAGKWSGCRATQQPFRYQFLLRWRALGKKVSGAFAQRGSPET